MSLSFRSVSSLVLVELMAVSCGQNTTPVEPTPSPTPVVVATPTPAPTPVNARLACGVGRGTGDGQEHNCPRSGSHFMPQVDEAINSLVAKSPQYFDLGIQRGAGGYLVKTVDAYYRDVVQELGNMGLCAIVDGGGEIAVKSNNQYSDQYHIMISSGHVRRGDASYRATCVPAWF